jgi:hypothetical protein
VRPPVLLNAHASRPRPSFTFPVLLEAWAGSVYSCRDDPCLPRPRDASSWLVVFATGPVVASVDQAGVDVSAGVVVLVGIQAVGRAQYVVGILGLPSSVACGGGCCSIPGGRGAADGSTISAAAGGPVLIVPPCGLGLIPISSIVQIFVLSKVTNEMGEKGRSGQNSLRDIWRDRSSVLRHNSRTPKKSWQRECPRH